MIDRVESRRADAEFLESVRNGEASRFVVFAGSDVLLAPGSESHPARVTADDLARRGVPTNSAILLGLAGKEVWLAVDVGPPAKALRPPLEELGRFVTLASIQGPVDEDIWSLLAQARALLAWNAGARHCPACGADTEMQSAGYIRRCTAASCGALSYPRSDPAVIVRVTHGERCLLARGASWRQGLRSVLAGFVEPGESLEDAVRREVKEEVGLVLTHVEYVGSQPWPFPMSLMVAFTARAESDRLTIDDREIEGAAWFTREEVREHVARGTLALPTAKSIARHLIDTWLDAR
ncbi:MAG: NAD(+) diphosphatase [Candidatus Bipolaricaulota bacterium]